MILKNPNPNPNLNPNPNPQHNETIGTWLTAAGYHTAFLGKYVNNMEATVPHGWSHWGGFKQTYNFYNASIHDMDWASPTSPDPPVKVNVMTGTHQADFLGKLAIDQARMALSKGSPFFISITPVMPHWGTCYGPEPGTDYANTDPHWEWKLTDPSTGEYVNSGSG